MMAKGRTPDFLSNRKKVTEKITAQDRKVAVRREEERGDLNALHLESIKQRASDTRPLNDKHVVSLMESIAILGLIEPLAVDQEKVLLAGGHRLAAILMLQETDPEAFEHHFPGRKVPVRIMPFVASAAPERALQVEVAENEHRRDYTPSEVRSIADHLRQAGYRDSGGRPKKGEKALMPALSVVIGKNRRTIHRYLSEQKKEKTTTDVTVFLKKAKKSLESWQKDSNETNKNQKLRKEIPDFLALIDEILAADESSK